MMLRMLRNDLHYIYFLFSQLVLSMGILAYVKFFNLDPLRCEKKVIFLI